MLRMRSPAGDKRTMKDLSSGLRFFFEIFDKLPKRDSLDTEEAISIPDQEDDLPDRKRNGAYSGASNSSAVSLTHFRRRSRSGSFTFSVRILSVRILTSIIFSMRSNRTNSLSFSL